MRRLVAGLVALLSGCAFASAQDSGFKTPIWYPGQKSDWTVNIGAEARMVPTYNGSNRYTLAPVPLFDIRRAGTPPNFRAPRDGFGFGFYDTGSFRAGPTVKVRLSRREGDDIDLRGLGNVDWAFEIGGFAEYWVVPWLRARGEVRQGFGGHHGVVGDFTADAVAPIAPKFTLSGGPRLTVMSSKAVTPYFSIDATQSANSGLPVYNASGGVYSWGAGTQLKYDWSQQWETHVFIEYERLTGSAAESPITSIRGSRDQLQLGIGASYTFNMRPLW